MNLDTDGWNINSIIAAISGALLGTRSFPEANRKERAANFGFGLLIAVFVAPAIVEYLHITSLKIGAFIIFTVGMAGLVFFSAVIDGIRNTQFGAAFTSWLSRNRGV